MRWQMASVICPLIYRKLRIRAFFNIYAFRLGGLAQMFPPQPPPSPLPLDKDSFLKDTDNIAERFEFKTMY